MKSLLNRDLGDDQTLKKPQEFEIVECNKPGVTRPKTVAG